LPPREQVLRFLARGPAASLFLVMFVAAGPIPSGVDPGEFEKAARVILCDCGCHPQSVYDCACGRAAEMREEIAAEIRKGRTGEEVIAAYVARYGEKILISPAASGFNLVAWLGPGIALGAGLGGLMFVIRRWTRRTGAEPAPAPVSPAAPDDPYLAELERQLQEDR